ncbi:hypothetical protein BWQ96_08648 [Gracilariopsis chorda]|uniref:Uncharacterized protein n=1 Tax=Gracilariopsis chorda TaxID=448386 RepID=A0A2V3IHS9_9FLOR|nr:hypothetical protein BWQ96_08648 [Gracilariopsis chorda]|eukprot:PXF41637.1 hypothetical protein BWQ96_08648 [Gracilariopsis chorda]
MTSTQAACAAASAVKQAATQAAKNIPKSLSDELFWVRNMPTRAIAHFLMGYESRLAPHDELFDKVNASGLMRSKRHFKHCLKMMRLQKRVDVVCLGPQRVGSSTRKFAVKLTSRGNAVYRYYRNCERWQVEHGGERPKRPGLTDAL